VLQQSGSKQKQDLVQVQSKLKEKSNLVVSLEKKISALTSGYQWLTTLKDGAQFKEVRTCIYKF